MWTRNVLILACCLAPSMVRAAPGSVPENAEIVPVPAAAPPQMSAPVPDNSSCDTLGIVPKKPWYYWWNPHRGREQHYAYLPPLPGWYYFRPYSIGQLRAQQEAVQVWGGDPRNPYTRPPEAATDVIKWPSSLLNPRFNDQRAKIEVPYRRSPSGQANPSAADYQNMIDAVAQMRATLGQTSTEMSKQDYADATGFLDQLVSEARRQSVAQTRAQQKPLLHAGSDAPELASATSLEPPEPAADIINWPSALRDQRFVAQRSTVEACYRNNSDGSTNPSAVDCQKALVAAEQMKTILSQRMAEIPARDRLDAEKFLDQLSAAARLYSGTQPRAPQEPTSDLGYDSRGFHSTSSFQHQPMEQTTLSVLPSAGSVSAANFESAMPAAAPPQAATDIIPWPPVLHDQRFAEERARAEAPYRRNSAEQTNPSAADYQSMIDAVGQMRTALGSMAAEIPAQDYLYARRFLDQLSAELSGRIEKDGMTANQPLK